jgi:hypothetical protein
MKDGQEIVNEIESSAFGSPLVVAFGNRDSGNGFIDKFDSIADWVAAKFGGIILESSCSLCSISPNKGVLSPSVEVEEGTFFNANNYSVPLNCSLEADNKSVCCNDTVNSGCYGFSSISDFFLQNLTTLCGVV